MEYVWNVQIVEEKVGGVGIKGVPRVGGKRGGACMRAVRLHCGGRTGG